MAEEMHDIFCSKCNALLFQYEPTQSGWRCDYPPWGIFIVAAEPSELVYDTICAQCGNVDRFKAVGEIVGTSINEYASFPQGPKSASAPGLLLPTISISEVHKQVEEQSGGPLAKCILAFAANVERIAAIGNVPTHTVGLSVALRQLEHTQTIYAERFRQNKVAIDWSSRDAESLKQVQKDRWALFHPPLPPRVQRTRDFQGHGELMVWAAAHPDIKLGVTTILSAQIALAWTAFEMLAEDLWVSAVNSYPNPLAIHFSKSHKDKSLTLSELGSFEGYDFNLSAQMGRVLVETKKADFASLEATEKTYGSTFERQFGSFDWGALRLLESLRNLIMHQAGQVDDTFRRKLKQEDKQNHPECANLELNKPFPITTELTERLVKITINQGIDLVVRVSKYLQLPVAKTAAKDATSPKGDANAGR